MSAEKKAAKADKYRSLVLPRLGEILDWARAGADLKEIAEKLGVGYTTLRSWVKKGGEGEERYVPLAVVLAAGQETPNNEVEAALYKKCLGYNAKIAKHYKVKVVEYDPDTMRKTAEREELREVFDEVHVPADTNAMIFYLVNRLPQRWQRDPSGQGGTDEENTGVIEMPAVSPVEESNG